MRSRMRMQEHPSSGIRGSTPSS